MGYGIDIGSSAVKVVAMRRGLGGFKVTAAMRRRLPFLNDADPQPLYHKLVGDALGGRNGRRAGVVGLSGRDINLQIVQQPNMKPLNYRQMMRYELDQRRGEATDLYMDYCTLREPDQYFPQYLALIGIGKSDYVDGRISILSKNGVDVRDAVPNAFALFTAYKNAYGSEGGTVLLLDIGADNMDMAFVRGGRLIFARNVSSGARVFDTQLANMLGLSTMDEAEGIKVTKGTLGPSDEEDERSEEVRAAIRGAAGQITGFITSSINYAKLQLQDRELTVDKIYLSGGGARIRGLPEYLQGATKIAVEILDPFRKIDTSAIDKQGGAEFRTLPTDMAVALGLAQLVAPQPGTASLSILPESLKTRRTLFRTTVWMGAAAAVLVPVLLVLTGLAWVRGSSNESARAAFMRDNKQISDRIDAMDKAEREQLQLTARTDYLLAHVAPGRGILDVVARLRRQPAIIKEKTIRLRSIRTIDPTGDLDALPGDRRRVAFLRVGGGFVTGDLDEDRSDRDKVVLVRDPETEYTDEEIVDRIRDGVIEYPSESLAIRITGELDENIRGGPRAALNKLRDVLTDERKNMRARVGRQRDSDKPGWRRFEIMVRFD